MTEWKIILKGKDKHPTDQQVDEVGNIYQKGGGVNPKACQKCHKEFDAPTKKIALKQNIPLFECNDCEYSGYAAESAMSHIVVTGHKINKKNQEKIVGYENIITGAKAMIDKVFKNGEVVDVNVLCADCFNLEAFRKRIKDE